MKYTMTIMFVFGSLWNIECRYYGYGLSQWETTLHCNVISHWLSPYREWSAKSEFPPGRINKANLGDLIAATGLVILIKSDPNHQFFSPCDLEIWLMTSKNNRAPLLYQIKLWASFQIHRWIKTEVTVRKRSIWVKIGDFWSRVTLKFDRWPWKTIWHLF